MTERASRLGENRVAPPVPYGFFLLIGLWILLWDGLNTGLGAIRAGGVSSGAGVRAWVPVIAFSWAVISTGCLGHRRWSVPTFGPVGLLVLYGFVAVVAGLGRSADSTLSSFFGLSFLAVPLSAILFVNRSDSMERSSQLFLPPAMFIAAFSAYLIVGAHLNYNLVERFEPVTTARVLGADDRARIGVLAMHSNGAARFFGLAGLLFLSYLGASRFSMSYLPIWFLLADVFAKFLLAGSRTDSVALAIGLVVLFIALHVWRRAAMLTGVDALVRDKSEAWARDVPDLLANPGRSRDIAKAGRRLVRDRYDGGRIIDRLDTQLGELLENGRHP